MEIVAGDLTATIENRPAMKLRLTNVLNRPIQGTITAQLGDLQIQTPESEIRLEAHQTREVVLQIVGGRADEGNSYPLSVTFDTGPDGKAEHRESMRVDSIAKHTIAVDGNLEDWQGAIPQSVDDEQRIGLSMTEAAYLPFQKVEESRGSGTATAWLAHDQDHFYFAARVSGKGEGMIRFETRDDDRYFYPEKVTDEGKELLWPAGVRRFSYRRDPDLPSGNGQFNIQIAFNVVPPEEKPMLTHPTGTMPRFMSYMDTDYEFALNPVADQYGGPVKTGSLIVRPDGDGRIFECAIPWSEMPLVKQRLDAGQTVKFSYRINKGSAAYELAVGRSVSKDNPWAFHNDWSTHWANELEFGAEK